jgi:hypothetical protein
MVPPYARFLRGSSKQLIELKDTELNELMVDERLTDLRAQQSRLYIPQFWHDRRL